MLAPAYPKLSIHKQRQLLICSIIAACAVIHTPAHFVENWLHNSSATFNVSVFKNTQFSFALHAMRGFVFFISITFLLYIVIRPTADFFSANKFGYPFKKMFQNSLVIFFVSGILVIPTQLGIMGVGYGQMSNDPFIFYDASNQIYQRILMPAIAYFLQFKGPILFHLFSLIVTLCLIFFTLLFFEVKNIRTTLLEGISLASTSFIITQFQSPGYTEQLSLLLALIVLIVPMDTLSKIAALSLALFAHEVSILIFLVIGWLYFSKEEKGWFGFVIVIYVSFWLMSFGFDLARLFEVRTVGNLSGFAWIIRHPLKELGGIFMSYKLLWLVLGIALSRISVEMKNLLVLVLPGIFATLFAVDTTRLMAFGFLAILFALVYVKKYSLITDRNLQLLFGLNLCMPSVYIGLNSGLVYFDGLYQLLYRGYLFR